jgi:hypothetical protein
MNNAPLFHKSFFPYRKQYICEKAVPGLFPDDPDTIWITIEQYLTDGMINRSINGNAQYGFFLAYCTRSFGIDIDDHHGKGWAYLMSVYNTVCSRFQSRPSLVVRSPHGLHVFYLFDHPLPEILVVQRVREMVRGVPAEVKPTCQVGLRIPVETNLLNPETLHPLQGTFADILTGAYRFHPLELFHGDGLSPKLFVESLKDRKAKVIANKTWEKVCRAEAEYAGIKPGTTNDALCELIPVYRSAGLTAEEAAAEFAALLVPQYDGELRQERRLLQRVTSFYRHIPETRFTAIPKDIQVELFTQQIAYIIAGLVTGPSETPYQRSALTKKKGTIRKAVIRIEQWRIYIDSVISDKRFFEMWNYLYPYFSKNTKEGYYPLSRNILKQVHEHYERYLLSFLIEIGYLKRSPYKYSSVYGICYYYEIRSDDFIARQPQVKPAVVKPKSKAELRAEAIRAYKREHPEATVRDIAVIFGCSIGSVSKYMNS